MFWPFRRRAVGAPHAQSKVSEVGPLVSAIGVGQPVWTPREFDKLADEAYTRNAVAFRCIKMIATAGASIPWLMTAGRDKKELDDAHPLAALLERPGPNMSGDWFMEAVYSFLLIAGNAYVEAVSPGVNDTGAPTELWPLRPDRVKVVAGQYGLPQAYRYEANGRIRDFPADPVTGEGAVLHLRDFHPLDDWYGMSRVEAAAYGVDRHNAASAHNKALLDNGMQPSGVLVVKPVIQGGMVQRAPDEFLTAVAARLESRHMGSANAGRPLVLGGDLDWKQLALSPRDMDFSAGKDDAARDICSALGVPHILIVPGASTYNNVAEAKLALYEETIIPLVERVSSDLTRWLAPRFGGNIVIKPDLDRVSALEPRRETKRKATVELFDKGLLTRDEAREALDYEPQEDAISNAPDAAVLSALVLAVQNGTLPIGPLRRYCVSVGLVDANVTDEQLLADAEAHGAENQDESTAAGASPEPQPDE